MNDPIIIIIGVSVTIALLALAFVVLTGRRVGRLEARITGVEAALKHLPDRNDLHRIEVAMERMAGGLDARRERETALTKSVDRIENYLLGRDNRNGDQA